MLSIILPTKNNIRTIEQCLNSLINQSLSKDFYEIIYIDNFSTDGSYELAMNILKESKLQHSIFQQGPERHKQRPAGVDVSNGKYLYFIDSDMYADTGLLEEMYSLLESKTYDALIIPEVNQEYDDYWTRVKAFERTFYQGDDQTEAGRVFHKKDYLDVGGFNPNLIAAEDRELTDRIRKAGLHFGRTSSGVIHDEGIIKFMDIIKKKYYYASCMKELITHTGGSFLSKILNLFSKVYFLRPVFYKKYRFHLKNPILSLGLFVLLVAETIATGLGFMKRVIGG